MRKHSAIQQQTRLWILSKFYGASKKFQARLEIFLLEVAGEWMLSQAHQLLKNRFQMYRALRGLDITDEHCADVVAKSIEVIRRRCVAGDFMAQGKEQADHWICMILYFVAWSYARRLNVEIYKTISVDDDNGDEQPGNPKLLALLVEYPDMDSIVDKEIALTALRVALRKLTTLELELLQARYVEESSYVDLAERYRMSPGAVRVRLHRIVEKLRNYFHECGLL